jgi:hypothetical protein
MRHAGGVLSFRRFVTAQILLSFDKNYMPAQLGAVLAQRRLVGGVHGIFGRVIKPLAAFFANESYDLPLVAFFSHRLNSLTDTGQSVNTKNTPLWGCFSVLAWSEWCPAGQH